MKLGDAFVYGGHQIAVVFASKSKFDKKSSSKWKFLQEKPNLTKQQSVEKFHDWSTKKLNEVLWQVIPKVCDILQYPTKYPKRKSH